MEADLEETVRLTILQHEVRRRRRRSAGWRGQDDDVVCLSVCVGGERHLRAAVLLQTGAVLGRVAQ